MRGLWLTGRALLLVYGVLLTLFLLLRPLTTEPTEIALINRYLPLTLLPAPLLLILLARLPRLAVWFIVPAALALTSYGGLFLPRSLPALPDAAPRLSVATYNLAAIQTEIEPLAQVIRDLNADVVALQELSVPAAHFFSTHLLGHYPHQALQPHSEGYNGHGILSRYPLLSSRSYPYQPDRLRLQHVVVDFAGIPTALYNVHLQPITESWRMPDVGIQRGQLRYILAEAAADPHPRLLLGDFNTSDQTSDYGAIINAGFVDAYMEAGRGMGFTNPVWSRVTVPDAPEWLSWIPVHRRIDYVFHDAAWVTLAADVWPDSGGSDHYPLAVSLSPSSVVMGNVQASASGNTPLKPTSP